MRANHCWRSVSMSVHSRQLMVVTRGRTTLGLPMGGLAGYIALGLDSYSPIGAFIRSTHTVNNIHRQGLLHTRKEKIRTVKLTHTNSLTCLSTGLLVSLPCLSKRLHTQAGHVIFSYLHWLFFPFCLCTIWHKVDRHVSCACGLLLWKFFSFSYYL